MSHKIQVQIVDGVEQRTLKATAPYVMVGAMQKDVTMLDCRVDLKGDFIVSYNPRLTSLANGPKSVGGNYIAMQCGFTHLDCADLEVGKVFNVCDSPLESFRNGPRKAGDVKARNCPLRELACRQLETRVFDIATHDNQYLRHALDGPKCVVFAFSTRFPVLGMVGRCGTLRKDNKHYMADSLFRTKLTLILDGLRVEAALK